MKNPKLQRSIEAVMKENTKRKIYGFLSSASIAIAGAIELEEHIPADIRASLGDVNLKLKSLVAIIAKQKTSNDGGPQCQ